MKTDAGAHVAPTDAASLPMELGVYGCAGNAVLFVPAAVQPPLDATAAHGPLAFRGTVFVDPAASASWREILKQIDRHLFATIGVGEFELLVGSAAPVPALDRQAI